MAADSLDVISPACTVVKWNSPAEELSGIARFVASLIQRGTCLASDIRLVVPSVNWGIQLQHACEAQGLEALFCAPQTRLSVRDRQRLAKLAALARPRDTTTRQASIEAGVDAEELDALIRDYADARGHTLVRVLGLRESLSLRHAVLHVRGDENAQELEALVTEQIENPTFPPELETLPIVLITHTHSEVRYVFAVGCVDGLVPSYGKTGDDNTAHQSALQAGREAFASCIRSARETAVVSYFTRIEEHVAQAAGISFTRTRLQDGSRVAMTRPTPYLVEWGSSRPTTIGGQALLRENGLN